MSAIRCLCLDVDGVLTDGRLLIDESGRVSRSYHIQDGLAIQAFREHVGEVVIVSGKGGGSIANRAAELGIRHVVQNSRDKLADLRAVLQPLKIELSAVAAIGDDLQDLPLLLNCGCPIAVANAVAEVRAAAKFVTQRCGGDGAVREAIEMLLRAVGVWPRVVEYYRRTIAAAADA